MNVKSKALSTYSRYLICTLLIFVLYVISIFVISFICWKFDVAMTKTSIFYYIACVAGTSLNSFVFAMLSESKGWLKGIIGGIFFLGFVYLFGFIVCRGEVDSIRFLYKFPLFILLSFACGVFGINFRN